MDGSFDRIEHHTTLIINSHKVEMAGIGNANQGRLTSRLTHKSTFPIEVLRPIDVCRLSNL
jgi:hypothetical protein